jgi:hypothetical protein
MLVGGSLLGGPCFQHASLIINEKRRMSTERNHVKEMFFLVTIRLLEASNPGWRNHKKSF